MYLILTNLPRCEGGGVLSITSSSNSFNSEVFTFRLRFSNTSNATSMARKIRVFSLATDQNISEDSTNVNNTTPEAEFKTTTVYSPSFDCNKASQAAEITICGNSELSKLDVQNTSLYKEAKEIDPETVKNILKISIKSKYSCKTNVECIKLLYDKSISDYSKIISKNNSN